MLSDKEYDDLVTTFYTNALKAIPEAGAVFERPKTPIVKLGRIVFGMFGMYLRDGYLYITKTFFCDLIYFQHGL